MGRNSAPNSMAPTERAFGGKGAARSFSSDLQSDLWRNPQTDHKQRLQRGHERLRSPFDPLRSKTTWAAPGVEAAADATRQVRTPTDRPRS